MHTIERPKFVSKDTRHRDAYREGVEFYKSGAEYRNKYTLSDMLEYHSFHAGYCDAVRGYV